MYKPALLTGSIFALLCVVIGAFGAHYLKAIFTPETLLSFETGVRYQFYHSIALLFTGMYAKENPLYYKSITCLFSAGIILFSGSIYTLCLLKSTMNIGLGGLGMLTPIGGLCFIAAWFLLIVSVLKSKKN